MILKVRYSFEELLPYINWAYFFHAWSLPKGNDDTLQKEALALAESLNEKYGVSAICGLWRAKSIGDDILLPNEEYAFHFLRQQQPSPNSPFCLSLADFIDEDSNSSACKYPIENTIGAFAASVDAGAQQCNANDAYGQLLHQTLCDRLAEAATEKLHEYIRKEVWAYAKEECLTKEDLFAEKFQGIRPAVGYPSLPDQSIIFEIDHMLKLENVGIRLTENGSMCPHASVAGFMFGRKEAQYFSIGKIDEHQLNDYAERKGMSIDALRKFLQQNLQK